MRIDSLLEQQLLAYLDGCLGRYVMLSSLRVTIERDDNTLVYNSVLFKRYELFLSTWTMKACKMMMKYYMMHQYYVNISFCNCVNISFCNFFFPRYNIHSKHDSSIFMVFQAQPLIFFIPAVKFHSHELYFPIACCLYNVSSCFSHVSLK